MKADAALLGSALLCILIAGTLTTAKSLSEDPDVQSETSKATEETTTATAAVTTVTSITRQPTTHLTETPLVTTSKTETTTATAASTTVVSTTHRQTTSESPQTITHLTTERTTERTTTTTTKAPTTTTTTTAKAPTTTPTTTTTKRATTTTTSTTPVPSTTAATPGVVTHNNGNPTTQQTGGSEFPIWPRTTASPSTTKQPPMSSTTPKPTTSHSSGSTSSSTTTHSTTHRPTTTSKPTTTTLSPTPTLPPNPSSPAKWWNVVYDSNGTNCMMIRFAAQIDVTYLTVDNRTVITGFDIPGNASVDGSLSTCDKSSLTEVFALNFASHSVADGYLVAIFKKNAKTNASSLFELMVSYPITKELFPGISPKYLNKVILLTSTNLTQFETDPLHCYTCNSRLSLNFTSIEVKDVHGGDLPSFFYPEPSEHIFKQSTFVTRDLKIQAFLPTMKNMDIFMPGKLCQGDKPDTLWTVDFIVAVVIAGLVAITLIIYYGVKKYKARNAPSEDTLPIVEE